MWGKRAAPRGPDVRKGLFDLNVGALRGTAHPKSFCFGGLGGSQSVLCDLLCGLESAFTCAPKMPATFFSNWLRKVADTAVSRKILGRGFHSELSLHMVQAIQKRRG